MNSVIARVSFVAMRFVVVAAVILFALVGASGAQHANAATGRLLQPDEVLPIAAGLTDATGGLAAQCGMSKLGGTLRGATPITAVASGAVKASLAVAKANKGCAATVKVLEAVTAMVLLAETGRPVWVSLEQSTKTRPFLPDTCTVVIRTGPSERWAVPFKASFSC